MTRFVFALSALVLLIASPAMADSGRYWTLYGSLGGAAVIGPNAGSSAAAVHPGHGSDTSHVTGGNRGAGLGSLTGVWSFHRLVGLEIAGEAGFAEPGASAIPEDPMSAGDLWQRIAIGVRLEKRDSDLRPFVAARALHIHMAPWEVWRDNPGQAFAGGSSVGVEHRSGLAVGTGASVGIPYTRDRGRLFAAGELAWVPVGSGPQLFPSARLGLALRLGRIQ